MHGSRGMRSSRAIGPPRTPMRMLGPEDVDVPSDDTGLLPAHDLVAHFHRQGVVEIDVLRLPVAFVPDGDDDSVRWVLGLRVECLDDRVRAAEARTSSVALTFTSFSKPDGSPA